MSNNPRSRSKISVPWIKPFIVLFVSAIVVYLFGRGVDHLFILIKYNPFTHLFPEELDLLSNTLGGLAEVVTSVLSIEITALAIIVQLAANKYSSKIFELFFENRVNVIILFIYVITAVVTVIAMNTLNSNETAKFAYTITQTLFLVIMSLVIVIPHFNYVFHFLRPDNFLLYVEDEIRNELERVANGGRNNKEFVEQKKIVVNDKINFIGDVAINSITAGDRATTLMCITSLRNVLSCYIGLKSKLPERWNDLSGDVLLDPDFASFAPNVLDNIAKKKNFLRDESFQAI
ncbi:MAG: DUF2254 domain-containing protein [Ignavibacteriaceae bacterium]|nr:DUF2254 domain-containing protein [Ignavibacteriaceae bacterium]